MYLFLINILMVASNNCYTLEVGEEQLQVSENED